MGKIISKVVSVTDIANGAVDDLVIDQLPKILRNMGDENTKWNVERGMDIKIRFKMTDETRETSIVTVELVPKMANPKPYESTMHLTSDGENVEAVTLQEEVQPELDNVIEMKQEAK